MQFLKPLTNDSSLQFMPVMADKKPIHLEWQHTKKNYDFSRAEAIGLVCGSISGNLEAIDLDLKYDLTKTLYEEYKRAIHEINPKILKKIVVQSTVSGGYHFIYRCEYIEGNKKLAERHTTKNERQQTYDKTYAKLISGDKPENLTQDQFISFCEEKAARSRDNDRTRVLLETRGEKGYIACAPTKGYELKHLDFDKIETITKDEREVLINVAYSFNQVLKEPHHDRKIERKIVKGLTSIEDYNNRGDVVSLLENHGWERVGKKGSKILMKRPGDTKASHSGNFDEEKNWFSVFSTSTEFESQTPYQPYAVYAILECNGNWSEVPIKLYDLGFGDRRDVLEANTIDVPTNIDATADATDFLASNIDYDAYLEKWRNGTWEKGLTTGSKLLDNYFLFKEADLVIINGIDNVGKSTVIWYKAVLSAMYHDWKWLIFSSENKIGGIIRKLIEFYWCEPIDKMSLEKFKYAKQWVREHFDIIKSNEKLFNYEDILTITTLAKTKKEYNGLLIDPYNSLKVDSPSKNKGAGNYDYHYEAASKIKLYGSLNNLSIYINTHVGTAAAKNKDTKTGYTKAPQKEDSEMGVIFANKADEFITIHRVTQHETESIFTEIHIRKVKETETGGNVTRANAPIIMRPNALVTGFEILPYKSHAEVGENPVLIWHNKMLTESQQSIFSEQVYDKPSPVVPEYSNQPTADLPF